MSMKRKGSPVGKRCKFAGYEICPICGGDSHCVAFAPGEVFDLWDPVQKKAVATPVQAAVLCMYPPEVERGREVSGFTSLGTKAGQSGGRYFVAAQGARGLSDADRARHEQAEEQRRLAEARKLEQDLHRARGWWDQAEKADHAKAAAYLPARGVPVGSLPASLWGTAVRFHPALPYFHDGLGRELEPGPALLLSASLASGAFATVHRIYLELDGRPAKRTVESDGEAKKAWVAIGGKSVKLGGVAGAKTLVLCEGFETAAMILAVSPENPALAWHVEACISGLGMGQVEIDPSRFGAGGYERVIVAGDLDDWSPKHDGRPGHLYAEAAAVRLRGLLPGVRVDVAIPAHRHAPDLVNEHGQPVSDAGCDWLDVGRARLDQVAAGMLWAAEKAPMPPISAWEVEAGKGGAKHPAGTRASELGAEEPPFAVGGGGEGEEEHERAGSPPPGKKRTRASGSDDVGPDTGEDAVRKDEGYFHEDGFYVDKTSPREGEERPLMPKGDLPRAEIMLRTVYNPHRSPENAWAPPEGGIAGAAPTRFTIAYWGDAQQWLRWTGTKYEPVDADTLRGDVLRYFLRWYTKDKKKNVSLAGLSTHQAASIVEALKTHTTFRASGLPCWGSPTIGADGRPLFDTWRRTATAGGVFGRHVISFLNGLVDIEALRDRRAIEIHPHTALRISTTCMPYDLPVDEMREEMERDPRNEFRGAELCGRLCPNWTKFTVEMGQGDDDVTRCLQQYLGYILWPDCKLERMLYLIGGAGVGKGTILDVIAGMVGEDAVAASSLDNLVGRFDLSTMLGRSVVFFDEFEAGNQTDIGAATRQLKTLIGNAFMPVDMKNKQAMASVKLNVKVIATGNRLQQFRDAANSFDRRMVLLRIPKLRAPDPKFKPKVAKESRGIMVWAFFGMLDLLQTEQFVVPVSSQRLMRIFSRLASPVHAFLEDCCVAQPAIAAGDDEPGSAMYRVKAALIYDVFRQWCESKGRTGSRIPQMDNFSSDLAAVIENFNITTEAVGGEQFDVWHGLRPKFQIDDKHESDWTDEDRRASAAIVLANQTVAAGHGGGGYTLTSRSAQFGSLGFTYKDSGERAEHGQDDLPH